MAGVPPLKKQQYKQPKTREEINELQRKARTPKPSTTGSRGGRPTGSSPAPTSARVQDKKPRPQINIPPLLSAPAQAQQGAPKPKPKPKPKSGLEQLWDGAQKTLNRAGQEIAKDAAQGRLFNPLVPGLPFDPRGYIGRNLATGAVRAITNLGTLAYSLGSDNVRAGLAGEILYQIPEVTYPLLGSKPPSQMNQGELDRDQIRADLTGNLLVVGATPFKAALAAATTWKGKAVYGGAAFAANELLSKVFSDARGGNAANLVNSLAGTKLPLAVEPGDSYRGAWFKSLLPDGTASAVTGVGVGLTLRGAGIPLNAVKKRVARARAAKAEQAERAWQEANGFTTKDPESGAHDFSPEFTQPEPKTPAPGETAPADTAVDAPANTADIDPTLYDPALPTSTQVGRAASDLSDEQLARVASGSGPVVQRIEQELQAGAQAAPMPPISADMVFAPAESLANDYLATVARRLEARSPAELRPLFDPDTNPDLWREVEAITGADSPAGLTKADMLEALDAYSNKTGRVPITNRLTGAQMLGTSEIALAPKIFQYKGGTNEAGEQLGNSLSGVERWDPDAEGVAQVWRDAQGETGQPGQVFMGNGHNRFGKAEELGIPSLRVEYLDAPTAAEARLQAAVSNISDGKGTVFDAAKFARENGISDPAQLKAMGKPGASGFWKEGIALGRLPEDVFTAAVNEQIPVRRAVIIGESGADPETMRAAYRYLVEQGPENVREGTLREMLAMAGRSPSASSAGGRQGDLLTGTEWAQSFNEGMLAKANLAAAVRVMLGKEKKLFGTVGRQAKKIEQVGQVDAAAAKEISGEAARALNIFDELKYATGPVGDLLSEGTERILRGENPATVADGIKNRLAGAIKETMGQEAAPAVDVVQPDLMADAGRQAEPSPFLAPGTDLWHGTTREAAQAITQGGFKASKAKDGGSLIGDGVYFTDRERYASAYGDTAITGPLPEGVKVLDLYAQGKDIESLAKEIGVGEPAIVFEGERFFEPEQQDAIRQWALDNGYDGIRFDPTFRQPGEGAPEVVLYNMEAANRVAGAPIDRDGMKAQLLREAIENGEVRPPDAQIPELSEPSVRLDQIDMDKPVTPGSPEAQALVDEIRLTAQDMAEQDAINLAAKQAMREAEGYDLKTFDEKKAEGLLEGYSKAEEDEVLRQLDEAAKAYGESIDKGLELASDMRRLADEIDTGEANARAELSEWVQPTPPERPTPVRLSNSLGDQPAFSLPAELSKAAPRYGSRQVRFASDLDRAAYILLADAKKGTSKAAAKFREALVEQGLDPGAVAEHGLRVKAALRNSTPSGDGVIDLPAQGWMGGSEGEMMMAGFRRRMRRPEELSKDAKIEELELRLEHWNDLREDLPAIVDAIRKVGGNRPAILFQNYITKQGNPSWGGGGPRPIYGTYKWKEDLIKIALGTENMNPSTAWQPGFEVNPLPSGRVKAVGFHEFGHEILMNGFTDPEIVQVNSFFGRLKVLLYNITGAVEPPGRLRPNKRGEKKSPFGNLLDVLKQTTDISYNEVWNETYRQLVMMKREGKNPRTAIVDGIMDLLPPRRSDDGPWAGARREFKEVLGRVLGTLSDGYDQLERMGMRLRPNGRKDGPTIRDIYEKTASLGHVGAFENLNQMDTLQANPRVVERIQTDALVRRKVQTDELDNYNLYGWMSSATRKALAEGKRSGAMKHRFDIPGYARAKLEMYSEAGDLGKWVDESAIDPVKKMEEITQARQVVDEEIAKVRSALAELQGKASKGGCI